MIRGKRTLAAAVLQGSGLVSLAMTARRWGPPRWLTIVTYHRVDDYDAAREFDEGTLGASPAGFEQQIAILRREFTPMDPEDLRECLHGQPWPHNPALVTFDDGYRDNYERALPILQRYGVKALFFIATDYVERRRLFWWDRISYTLKRASRSRFTLRYPRDRLIDLAHGAHEPTQSLLRVVKESHALDIDRFLSELASAAGVRWDQGVERDLSDRLIMTWEQVRKLRQAGMGIGSHTRRHRVLATVPVSELHDELAGSRSELERALGWPVWALAYPVGGPIAHLAEVRAAVEAAGYEAGFTYNTGIQPLGCLEPLDIGRLAVGLDWTRARFRATLAFPRLAWQPGIAHPSGALESSPTPHRPAGGVL